jgi:hypothetical protein
MIHLLSISLKDAQKISAENRKNNKSELRYRPQGMNKYQGA